MRRVGRRVGVRMRLLCALGSAVGIVFSAAASPALADEEHEQVWVSVWPVSGPPDSELEVSGSGFWEHEEVKVYFGHSLQFFVTADGEGEFWGVGFKLHAHGPGAKMVTAVGQDSGRSAQTPFMIHTTWPGFGPDNEHSEDRSVFGGAPDLGRGRPWQQFA